MNTLEYVRNKLTKGEIDIIHADVDNDGNILAEFDKLENLQDIMMEEKEMEFEINSDAKVSLLSPWMRHAKKIKVFFEDDDDISMTYSEDDVPRVKMFVSNPIKAMCLEKIMKHEVIFGNVTLYVDVVPSNEEVSLDNLFKMAFAGNPRFSEFYTEINQFGQINYASFKPEVIQYMADDTSDIYGLESTLAEDIAREIFNDNYSVNYCTDPIDDLQPNWP